MRALKSLSLLMLTIGCMSAGYSLQGAETTPWRIISPSKAAKLLPQLPALAVVERRDDSGQAWEMEGHTSGTRPVAARDFQVCLESQGWRYDKVIPIGPQGRSGSLFLWRRSDSRIFLMLRESGAARTDFALTLETKPRRTGTKTNLKP